MLLISDNSRLYVGQVVICDKLTIRKQRRLKIKMPCDHVYVVCLSLDLSVCLHVCNVR